MFEKLLSVLPYNPSLVHQLSFYSRRMREEASIRRIGLVFIVLAFMVQFFAVLSPPQATTAASNNDLINGGVNSAADAKRNCNQNVQHYGNIMAYYGISCQSIGEATVTNIKSSADNYYSFGRLSYGQHNPTTGRATNQQPVNVPGAGTIYVRKLDSFGTTTYKVLKFHSDSGKVFFILFDCGNLASVGIPQPAAKPAIIGSGLETIPGPKPPSTPPSTPPCAFDNTIPSTDSRCVVCQYNGNITASNSLCKPCEESLSSTDTTACVAVHKSAANVTTGTADANGTTANPGDVITYSLFAQNNGKAAVKGFTFTENLSDVLDYSDVTDLHGGTISADKVVSWPSEDIAAAATATHQITVKVKDPVPQTPAAPGDPNHFDLIMTNVYGNTVNIKLPGSPAKTIETATTTTLPNTGPGSSLMIAGAIVLIGGYFYNRSRLLAKESNLAIQESIA